MRLTPMFCVLLFLLFTFTFTAADARTAADFDGRLRFFTSITVHPLQAVTPVGWGDAPASAEGQTVGGLDQRDGANLPVNVVGDEGTDVVSKWNGTILHEYGEWRAGGEVALRLTDCDRNTMSISWRARNRDGLGPLMRGPMGTCDARFELRSPGDHEFNINYYWHTRGNRRSTAQDSAASRWAVGGGDSRVRKVLTGLALGAVTGAVGGVVANQTIDNPDERRNLVIGTAAGAVGGLTLAFVW